MKRKVGPLPLWGWGLAIALGIGVFIIQRRKSGGTAGGPSAPAGGNIDPKTGLPYSLENIDPNTGLPYYLSQVPPPATSGGGGGSGDLGGSGFQVPGLDLATQLGSLAGVIQAYQTLGQLFNPNFPAPAPGAPQPPSSGAKKVTAPKYTFAASGVRLVKGQKLVPGARAVYHGNLGTLSRVGSSNRLGFHPTRVHGHHVKA